MKNIPYFNKNSSISQIKNAIHLIIGNNPNWEWVGKNNCFQPISYNPKENVNKPSIPNNFYLHSNQKIGKRNPNKLYNSLEWFRTLCNFDAVTKTDVITAAKQICNSRQWLQIVNKDGRIISVESNAKGTESYCKKLMGKILDKCKEIGAKELDCAFLTLTCDPKKYESLNDMWENYLNKEVRPVMENLRKNYGVEYVSVMESTAKMRPHIHILMFCPKSLFPELHKVKNETVLRYGKLFNYVKSHANSERFKIKAVIGDNKIHYLTKYVGKGAINSVFKILDNKKDLTPDDYKLLYEFVFLTAFRKRKVLMTRKGCKSDNLEQSIENEVSVFEEELHKWESLTVAEQRAYLNSLCTNSLLRNSKKIYSMSYSRYKEVFGHFPERNQDVSEENANIFEKNSNLVYDEENFYTLFIDFVLSPKTALLNRKFWWNAEQNIYDLFTDGYNLNDDKDFLQCCKDLINLYVDKCLIQGYPLLEVIIGKEGLSNEKELRKIGFGAFDVEVSEDPKEVYKTYKKASADRQIKMKGISFAIEREKREEEQKLSNMYNKNI